MLLLGRRLGHLALQDLLPLLVHVALHAGEGVVPHLAQVRLQVLLLRVVCAATQKQTREGEPEPSEPSRPHPQRALLPAGVHAPLLPGPADLGAAPRGRLPAPLSGAGSRTPNKLLWLLGHVRPVKYGKSRFCFKGRRCCSLPGNSRCFQASVRRRRATTTDAATLSAQHPGLGAEPKGFWEMGALTETSGIRRSCDEFRASCCFDWEASSSSSLYF